MKLVILTILTINIGAIHAATIESRPLNVDSRSLDEIPNILENKSAWITNTKIDNKNNITEFQAKYQDMKSEISLIYVIPMSLESKNFYNTRGDNYDACKPEYIVIEFDGKKVSENKTYFSSGKVWTDNSRYFDLSENIKLNSEGNYYKNLELEPFAPFLSHEKNLKITSNQTNDLYIPFVGAKTQLQNAQNDCMGYLKDEKNKLKAQVAKAEAEAKAKEQKEQARIDKLNKESKARYLAQMKKPDVQIGMTKQQVVKNTRWGMPIRINSLATKYGITEQWTYWGYKYLYFTNGKLVAIQK